MRITEKPKCGGEILTDIKRIEKKVKEYEANYANHKGVCQLWGGEERSLC
jgi:hypothetical protein